MEAIYSNTFAIPLGLQLILWLINFIGSLIALFISLFLLITHDDLAQDCIEPAELSGNIHSVSITNYHHPLILTILLTSSLCSSCPRNSPFRWSMAPSVAFQLLGTLILSVCPWCSLTWEGK